MMRILKSVSLVALLLATQACIVVHDDVITEDLTVEWSIDGVIDVELCDTLLIEAWEVQLRGPEDIDLEVDCRTSDWSTADALIESGAVEVGFYTVTVNALDDTGAIITQESADLDIDDFDEDFDNVWTLEFLGSDF